MENFGGIDIFIVAVLLISALLSAFRGFVSEMLGIGSWIIAGIVGFYSMSLCEPLVLKYIPKPLFANIISLVVISLITLVILTFLFSKVTIKVQKSVLSRLDHFLGFIFGVIRGIIIVELLYFMMMTIAPKALDKLQKTSQTFVYFERFTDSIKDSLPESLFDNPTTKQEGNDEIKNLIDRLETTSKKTKKKVKKETKKIEEKAEKTLSDFEDKGLFEALNAPMVENKKEKSEDGYDSKERQELDNLFLQSVEEVKSAID